ncbi:MAG: DNA-binding protein, partial [Noviherbaspirillum sp.]
MPQYGLTHDNIIYRNIKIIDIRSREFRNKIVNYVTRITLLYYEVAMARAGILYSHVAQAAAQLAEAGKNPTVDNVRTALGSTGSKSTIAPLLKRWKAENQAIAAQAEVGLPPTLLDAMKGVYDQLQEEVNRKLEEVRQAHEADRQAAAEHAQRLAADHQALVTTHAGLSREMEQTRSVLERLEAAHRESIMSLATAQSENSALQQRLADRAAQ